jgi:hypothetical protein
MGPFAATPVAATTAVQNSAHAPPPPPQMSTTSKPASAPIPSTAPLLVPVGAIYGATVESRKDLTSIQCPFAKKSRKNKYRCNRQQRLVVTDCVAASFALFRVVHVIPHVRRSTYAGGERMLQVPRRSGCR